MSDSNNIQFRGDNPGAVQYGNFINYYQFNPPENRLEVFPLETLGHLKNTTSRIFCLDIGCNVGDLTVKLQETLQRELKKEVFILAVDIDGVLIERAQEKGNKKVTFLTLDFMNKAEREKTLQEYMSLNNIRYFDITFCLSISMWIHLNHGDSGLMEFIYNMCKNSDLVFLEPQTRKSYRSAVKRLRQAGEEFPHFKTIQHSSHIEKVLEELFVKNHSRKLYETTRTKLNRKLFVFQCHK